MTDGRVVLAVVLMIGTFALGGLVGSIWLIDSGAKAEAVAIVSGLTGTALGALGSLLASTRSSLGEPSPVSVVNTESDPVPVDTKPARRS